MREEFHMGVICPENGGKLIFNGLCNMAVFYNLISWTYSEGFFGGKINLYINLEVNFTPMSFKDPHLHSKGCLSWRQIKDFNQGSWETEKQLSETVTQPHELINGHISVCMMEKEQQVHFGQAGLDLRDFIFDNRRLSIISVKSNLVEATNRLQETSGNVGEGNLFHFWVYKQNP